MAALEMVMQLKQRGASDPEIIQTLREEGFNPREINEALSQANIKFMVGNEQMPQENYQSNEFEGMQPSIMSNPNAPQPPSPNDNMPEYPGYQPPAQQPQQEYYPEYSQQSYYPEYQPSSGLDIETMNDVAEQIVEEKTNELKKQVLSFTKFKEELQIDVQKIEDRLTRIENLFNQLQVAILKKVGEYGEDIKNISNEMHQTQESFSKIINPLTSNMKDLRKIAKEPSHEHGKGKSKHKGAGFEDYLR